MNNNTSMRENIYERISRKTKETLDTLHEIWDTVGYNEQIQENFHDEAYDHIMSLYDDMVTEAKHRRNRIAENVQRSMEQLDLLQKELGVRFKPYTIPANIPLIELESSIQTYLSKLEQSKKERLDRWKELLDKQKQIYYHLGIKPSRSPSKFPSEEDINNLRLDVEEKIERKNVLEAEFIKMRESIMTKISNLDIRPSTSFECLVCQNEEDFILTENNMLNLREFHIKVDTIEKEAQQEASRLREDLLNIWKHMKEPNEIYEAFLEDYQDYSINTIHALKTELKRCKEKRRENIAHYILQIRNEMKSLWDACKFGLVQRNEFVPFNSQTYTDDLLALHEMELQKLREYYNSNRVIFELLDKREELFIKMQELENRADDPDRYHNRGGQLLAEEKERKIISKKLPQVHEQLSALMNKYESIHGQPFLIDGITFDCFVQNSWEKYSTEQENQKKARKEAKDKSEKKTLSSSKRTPRAGISMRPFTPLGTSKRKLSFDNSPADSTKRVCSAKKRRSPRLGVRLIQGKLTPQRNGKPLRRRSKSLDSTSDFSYIKFQEHLKNRTELRSSVIHEKASKESNKSKCRTPIRTPAKPLRNTQLTTKFSKSASKLPQSPNRLIATRLTPLPGRSIDF